MQPVSRVAALPFLNGLGAMFVITITFNVFLVVITVVLRVVGTTEDGSVRDA